MEPAAEPGVAEAVRLAAARAGIGEANQQALDLGHWWRAGLEDATARPPALRPAGADYVAAPSRRSTRGATRA